MRLLKMPSGNLAMVYCRVGSEHMDRASDEHTVDHATRNANAAVQQSPRPGNQGCHERGLQRTRTTTGAGTGRGNTSLGTKL